MFSLSISQIRNSCWPQMEEQNWRLGRCFPFAKDKGKKHSWKCLLQIFVGIFFLCFIFSSLFVYNCRRYRWQRQQQQQQQRRQQRRHTLPRTASVPACCVSCRLQLHLHLFHPIILVNRRAFAVCWARHGLPSRQGPPTGRRRLPPCALPFVKNCAQLDFL